MSKIDPFLPQKTRKISLKKENLLILETPYVKKIFSHNLSYLFSTSEEK